MVHVATALIAVLAATSSASIVARNADDSVVLARDGDVYVCSRDAGHCEGPQVVCGAPAKRDCEAVLAARGIDAANVISIAARCRDGSCTHPYA
ncbi:hypothetical protein ISF_05352 [Cordyceps fumosorosea ARSEF 2679]|uniref:Uncharacterized protein n=1 Tax=Cordyceps fumosorosea (strain ARSEF 2679) TaxID=1081104 RepID=A0A167V8I4_CORFA|nr:hypothetical protein ISF_05352 [Cordyceps fumosorosea ARSEF 2679]OAA62343.1 hypothetical protein ISF_05352 [Cordyceps fumosorosea ARSEF 2679]